MNMNMNILGKRIAELRRARGVKQEELAAYVNVTAQAVSKWENGGVPDTELLPRIADFFEVTLDSLFGRDGNGEQQGKIAMVLKIENAPEEEKLRIALDYCWAIERALCGAEIKDGTIDGGEISDYERTLDARERRYSSKLSDFGMTRMSIAPRQQYFFLMPDAKNTDLAFFDGVDYPAFFADLADRDFFNMCVLLHGREATKAFTPSLLVRELGVSDERAAQLLALLEKYRIVKKMQIEIDDGVLEVYRFCPSPSFVAMLVFAKEVIDPFNAYTYYWEGRVKPYFSK
ncbi:MAG: helix-turn-helix transcriptional regulator [Clostridia bacterium]|nr:helix-turn-helix transcriptional regulator [Clostridia bacterium]